MQKASLKLSSLLLYSHSEAILVWWLVYDLTLHHNVIFSLGLSSWVLSCAGKSSCMFWLNSVDSQHSVPILQVYTWAVHLHAQKLVCCMLCTLYHKRNAMTTWWHCTVKYSQDILLGQAAQVQVNLLLMGMQHQNTYRMTIFSPCDYWRGDCKGITAQSERLLQGDSEVQGLPVILDFWGNWRNAKERGQIYVRFRIFL